MLALLGVILRFYKTRTYFPYISFLTEYYFSVSESLIELMEL